MKKIIFILLILVLFASCATNNKTQFSTAFHSLTIDTILKDKISIRAIIVDNNYVWYAADKGKFGYFNLDSNQKFENKISNDSLQIEFRSIAKTSKYIYVLNIGNPALLYQISKSTKHYKLVYQEANEKVFYDSMQFWNDDEGIAIGDPIDDCFSVIITRDGGNSWQKTPCLQLPKTVAGEAAFAASNTNIIIKGTKTWLVSGGKKSRVFYSQNKGKTWKVFETPIVQGLAMTGIFTADFYNEKLGFIAGGNYEIPNQNYDNKAFTKDGGKTWQLISQNQGFGYASCIQYVPESNGKQLVSVGITGLFYSSDSGSTWTKFLENTDLFTIKFINSNTAIAAGKNCILKINFK